MLRIGRNFFLDIADRFQKYLATLIHFTVPVKSPMIKDVIAKHDKLNNTVVLNSMFYGKMRVLNQMEHISDPDIRISEYQNIRISEYLIIRISEYPNIRISEYPNI